MKQNYNVNMTGLGSLELGAPLAAVDVKINRDLKRVLMPTTPSSGMLNLGVMTTETINNVTANYEVRDGAMVYNVEKGVINVKIDGNWTCLVTEEIAQNIFSEQNRDRGFRLNARGDQLELAFIRLKNVMNKESTLDLEKRPVPKFQGLKINSKYLGGSYANCLLQLNQDANEIVPSGIVQDQISFEELQQKRAKKVEKREQNEEKYIDIKSLFADGLFTEENANKLLQFNEDGTKIIVSNIINTTIFTV